MSNPRSSASSVSDRSLTKTPLLSEPGNSDPDRRLGVNPRPKRVIIIDSDEDEKRKQRNSHPTIYQQYLEQINLPASAATVEHLSALGLIRNGLFLNSTGSINRMWKTGYEKSLFVKWYFIGKDSLSSSGKWIPVRSSLPWRCSKSDDRRVHDRGQPKPVPPTTTSSEMDSNTASSVSIYAGRLTHDRC